jgi:hypothetical protein
MKGFDQIGNMTNGRLPEALCKGLSNDPFANLLESRYRVSGDLLADVKARPLPIGYERKKGISAVLLETVQASQHFAGRTDRENGAIPTCSGTPLPVELLTCGTLAQKECQGR